MAYGININSGSHSQVKIGRPFPWAKGPKQCHGNIESAHVGGGCAWRRKRGLAGLFGRKREANRGFAIDLNRNGRYDAGRDGVLVFDFNRDGKFSKSEIAQTNMMMKAARGNYDLNGDGKVSLGERFRGARLRSQYNKLDRNRDGKLNTGEISCGGGKVWIDSSRDGKVGCGELHSPFNLPGRFCGESSSQLTSVGPYSSQTSGNYTFKPYRPTGLLISRPTFNPAWLKPAPGHFNYAR